MGRDNKDASEHGGCREDLRLASGARRERLPAKHAASPTEGAPANPSRRAWVSERRLAEAYGFRRLMGALLRFSQDDLGITSAAVEDALARKDAASDVLDALWENLWVLDEFVRFNPEGMDQAELDAARLWRYAITGHFVVTDAEDGLMALVTPGTRERPRLILANLLERRAEDVFRELPCLAELTLLPYHGRIVTDGRIKRISSAVMPGGHELIKQRLRLAMKSPPITTAEELIEFERRAAMSR